MMTISLITICSPRLIIHKIVRYYSSRANPNSRAYKILDVYLDEHLTVDHHTTHIISKLNRSLYCLNKLKTKTSYHYRNLGHFTSLSFMHT
jgi:hypothetical protein